MRVAHAATPGASLQALELLFGSIHLKWSLKVTPFGSKTFTFPVNVSVGRVKTRTFPVTVPVGSGIKAPLQTPTVELQFPSSSNVIVKAPAGVLGNAHSTPTSSGISAERAVFTLGQSGSKGRVAEGLATKSDFMIATSDYEVAPQNSLAAYVFRKRNFP